MYINGKIYSKDMSELHTLHDLKEIKYTDKVNFKIDNKWVETTYGRLLIWELSGYLPDGPLTKSKVRDLVIYINTNFFKEIAIKKLKELQDLGFKVATKSGVSLQYHDFLIDGYKDDISELQNQLIKNGNSLDDRLSKIDELINKHTNDWKESIDKDNPLYLMYITGARVTDPQIRQMIVAKGLLSEMDGSISPLAVTGSLGRGLSPYDYFDTCGPARRGMANNFFVVPAAGYFSRQLVNAARDLRIVENDCKTKETIELEKRYAIGRYKLDGTLITKEEAKLNPFERVQVRSALTCECNKGGLCQLCVGNNPATNKVFMMGSGIGTIAAQHLNEPTVQLGLRGKHVSGAVNLKEYKSSISNVLLDIIKSFDAVSTSQMSIKNSKSKSLKTLIEEFNGDCILASVKLASIIVELYKTGGIDVSYQYPEIILRACIDQVDLGGEKVGLRSYGDKGKILPRKISNCTINYPSWLKSSSAGNIRKRFCKAICNCEVSIGSYTEQIMSTSLQHFNN